MFVSYKISQQIAITAQQYRLSLSKATKLKVFQKYLYKICFNGICIKINRVQIIDNIILRKDAQILVILQVQLILLKLIQDEYFEGEIAEYDQKGIIVKFMNGLLEGRILPCFLHKRTIYNFAQDKVMQASKKQQQACQSQPKQNEKPKSNQNNENQGQMGQNQKNKQKELQGKWILPFDSKKAFTWKTNQKVRFKIQSTNWQKQNQTRFADIISLRADQEGLGPVSWWI